MVVSTKYAEVAE